MPPPSSAELPEIVLWSIVSVVPPDQIPPAHPTPQPFIAELPVTVLPLTSRAPPQAAMPPPNPSCTVLPLTVQWSIVRVLSSDQTPPPKLPEVIGSLPKVPEPP